MTEASGQGEAAVPATTIARLIEDYGDGSVDVLKLDIEGAETRVFDGDCSWLPHVRLVVVELHGPEAERTVRAAAKRFDFTTERLGEKVLFRNAGRRCGGGPAS